MDTMRNDRPITFFRGVLAMICCVCLVVFTMACDDDDSFDSELEEAKIAIDGNQFDKAISILTGMPQVAEVLETLGSAYVGKAGLNTFDILSALETGGPETVDIIGKMLGEGEQGLLSCLEIIDRLSYMDQGKTALTQSVGGRALSDDGTIKLGIYGLTDFVLVLGEVLCQNYGDAVSPVRIVGLTEAWVKTLKARPGVDFSTINVTQAELDQMGQDVWYVQQSVSILGVGNDLAEEFQAIQKLIDPNGDGIIVYAEFVAFLNGLGE
ncbi:hypothetical protein [Desulfoluna sp.]|uniref:hypothetical protein n=1 Tax=Desulfoluna sp. TaxID=2045199 RepID=UPI00261A0941|nr:hypothetical protein [Desulfoluna sp.]